MKYFVFVFLGLFAIAGLAVLAFGIQAMVEGTDSNSWPTAPGEIVRSDYEIVRNSSDDFDTAAKIRYTYEVVGELLEGDRVQVGLASEGSPAENRRLTNQYPVGAKVNVYYDPEEPTEAVLEPGIPTTAWLLIAVGAVFTAVPILISAVAFGIFSRLSSRASSGLADADSQRSNASTNSLGYLLAAGFFAVFLVVGLVVLGFGLSQRRAESASVNWPETTGKVVYSGIRHETRRGDDGREHSYYPRVVYDFVLDGTTYTSEGITLSDAGSSRQRNAAKAIKPYRAGKDVSVFYDPEDPYSAALKPGRSTGSLIMLIIGGLFSLIGGIGVGGITLYCVRKALVLDDGGQASDDGESYDPFAETERQDPFDRPWDEDGGNDE